MTEQQNSNTPFHNSIEVGRLLYRERSTADKLKTESAALFFIDTPYQEDEGLNYTQIAVMGEFGNGTEVFTTFEVGTMSPTQEYVNASDEQIRDIVSTKLGIEGEQGIKNLANWINGLLAEEDCKPLLESEKKRLIGIVEQEIFNKKGNDGIKQYQEFRSQPYHPES